MAGEDLASIYASLGLGNPTATANDLSSFQNNVLSTDPWNIAAKSLGSFQPNMQTWSPTAQIGTSFLKNFLAGAMGQYARNDATDQLNSVIQVMPALSTDPLNVAVPEGVDASAFGTLKSNKVLQNLQAKAQSAAENKGTITDLLKAVLPDLVKTNKISASDAISLATTNNPQAALEKLSFSKPNIEPLAKDPTAITGLLQPGRQSTEDKIKALTVSFMESGQTPSQASISARQQVEGEVKANAKSFDEAKAARDYGQGLLQMANTARAGMGAAGQTGPLNPLAKTYEYIASMFGSGEAATQIAGDTTLNSVAPDVIKMARPVGGGATSDFEARTYLGSGPSTSNTPEANAVLVSKLEKLGQLNTDYADFLEAYREANQGSIVGASKKWNDYKSKYPIFTGTGANMEINESRPDWREYFGGTPDTTQKTDLSAYTPAQISFMKSKGLIP